MLVLLVVVLQLSQAAGLECYHCLDVRNVSDCHAVVTCPTDNLCFTSARGTGDQMRFNLTCKPKQDCQTHPTTTAPPSFSTGSRDVDCSQCCATPACNTYLCSIGVQSITSPGACQDDPVFDCQKTSSFFDICSDIHHAKAVCKHFCGLCDLVDGRWADWGTWSACSVTCGNGTISRTRSCTNPSPAHGGLDCPGIAKQDSTCHLPACPISGGWSAWSPWGSCSVSCGVGLQRRDRSCSNPYPGRFGDHCFGDDKVYKSCFERSCADGAWSSWSLWGACSTTCDVGLQSRTRTCTSPSPSQLGRDCRGNDVDKQICNTRKCPEQKVAFSVYVSSSTLTSDKTPTFMRTILNTGSYNRATGKFTCPIAGIYIFSFTLMHAGSNTGNAYCFPRVNGATKMYIGSNSDARDQASGTIIVTLSVGEVVDLLCSGWEHELHADGTMFSDGAWSSWSPWGAYSATCDFGLQSRTRTCTSPSPSQFGRKCRGNDFMQQLCNTRKCPERKVAFSVYRSRPTLTSDKTPTFSRTILNTGSYDMATGKFTCPIAGLYIFSFTLEHNNTNTGWPNCYYYVNDAYKTYIGSDSDARDQASGTIIVMLSVGDVVYLKCYYWQHEDHSAGAMFNGVLITPN